MEETHSLYIQPDLHFIDFVRKTSGSDLSTCMQCGSCTAVCELSPEIEPYPRKEMIWAAWGLKDQLMTDPDIWLCYNCGDCTSTCPRDVKPGDVLAAIRQATWMHFSRPRFLSKWLSSPKYLPLVLLLPVLIIAGIIALAGTLRIPEGPVNYSAFFPHAWLNGSFSVFVLILLITNWIGIRKFSKNLNHYKNRNKSGFWSGLKEIILHNRFRKCEVNKSRNIAHMLVFGGFVLLLIVTLFAILSVVLKQYPLPFWHPIKILGNLAGLGMMTGLVLMAVNRLKDSKPGQSGQYTDWFFLISMFLLALSGMLVEVARFGNWPIAYHLYFIHLVLVWQIVFYLPFSKFGHMIYRTIAILKS